MSHDPSSAGPDAMGHPDPPRAAAWWDDALEVDATLEGQCEPQVLAARRAELAGNPALAERLAAREAFLAGLASAGRARRAGLHGTLPSGLRERVAAALAEARVPAPVGLRWMAAAAAVLLVGVGVGLALQRGGSEASAMPTEVLRAAQAARGPDPAPRPCDGGATSAPMIFPPVRDGMLLVLACDERDGRIVARLHRPEDLPSAGYAAVPEAGVNRGPDLGVTDLGDFVVYDIPYGEQRHYLAVSRSWLDREEALSPGRASCRACHNVSREGQANPHKIVQRSWRLGD